MNDLNATKSGQEGTIPIAVLGVLATGMTLLGVGIANHIHGHGLHFPTAIALLAFTAGGSLMLVRQQLERRSRQLSLAGDSDSHCDCSTLPPDNPNGLDDRFFNLSLDLLCVADSQGYFQHLNPAWETTLGYPQEELMAQPFIEFVHPSDRDRTLAEFAKVKEGASVRQFENRYQCKDGSYKWLSWTSPPIQPDEDVVYAIARDITYLKQAETDLQSHICQQAAVAELGKRVLENNDLDALLDWAVLLLARTLNVKYAKVLELLPEQDCLLLRAGIGWEAGLVGEATVPLTKDSQAGYTLHLRSKEPVICKDLRSETRFHGSSLLLDHSIISGISLTIPGSDECPFGVFSVHADEPRCFSRDDILFLQAIVNLLATALERDRSQARLQLLQRAIESSSNGIIITDALAPDNPVTYVNPAFERISGYPADEVLGKNCRFLQGEETDQPELTVLRKAIQQGHECHVTLRNYRKDGQLFWNDLYVSPISNGEGTLTNFIGIQTDITQRQQAEAALRESEARFRLMADRAPVLIWLSGTNKQCIHFNKVWLDFTGRTLEQEMGDGWTEGVHPDDLQFCLDTYITAFDARQPFEMEYRLRRFDGEYRWILDAGVPRFDADGCFLGYIGSCLDISDRKRSEEALRISEARLNRIIQTNSDGLAIVDRNGIVRFVNPAAEQLFNRPAASLIDHWLGSLYVVNEMAEISILQPNGKAIIAEMRVVEIAWNDEPAFLASLRDVTQRHQAEEEVRQTRNFLQTMIDHLPVSVFAKDGTPQKFGQFCLWNKASEQLFGHFAAEALGKTVYDLYSPKRAEKLHQQDVQTFTQQNIEEIPEMAIETETGDERILHTLKVPIFNDEQEPLYLLCISEDITERKQVEAQLRHSAFYDSLTNLPNRLLLIERINQAIKRAQRRDEFRFAVLFLDVDRFKLVNDSLGHFSGDRLLIAIARLLESCIRPTDTIARLGGDEFAILLEELADVAEARLVAQRIQQTMELPVKLGEQELFTSVSIGIAMGSAHYRNAEALLRNADIAMYRAKAAGRTCCRLFNQSMYDEVAQQLALETDLRHALERNELTLHYQPIVSLSTGEIEGFEALARWQHPQRGFVPPDTFIAIAEDTGLIVPIGQWILAEACRQASVWQSQFPERRLTVCVNLSGRQFAQSNLLAQIDEALAANRLSIGVLKLEITESILIENPDTAATILQALRSRQIQLCIDDFGTGYSSLSYLHRFPAHTLKIDRSFVSHMDISEENREIVRTVIALAHNLGMTAIAEGIETPEHLFQLRQLQCAQGQGYLFAKPLDADRATALIADGICCPVDTVQMLQQSGEVKKLLPSLLS